MELIRQQHDLEQGSEEWLQFRRAHKGASEAAAVMGLSRTTKRTELLRLKSTGMEKEFSDYVQKHVLDKGHEIEALARPIVEGMIGDDLYPTVWSFGDKSASCDGLSMCESIAWENKQYNDEYYSLVSSGEVPDEHMPQCQQVLMVTGAEKLFFTVSDGTEARTAGVWVYPDQDWFNRINAAWAQFDIDLAAYEHVEHPEKPQAEVTESFPVPFVQVKGELAIVSNLDSFGQQLRAFVGNMTKDPQDDQDFVNLESACKKLKEAEYALGKAEDYALAQFADVNAMRRTVTELKELARSHRLTSEKLVKSQKELIKMRILEGGKKRFYEHVSGLQAEIFGVTLQIQQPDFAGAMKNKRTIASLHDAVDTCLANAKIEADSFAKVVRGNIAYLDSAASGLKFLFNDLQAIAAKQPEDFAALVDNRVAQHKQAEAEKLEAERKRIQEEAEAKARAEQERKLEEERARIRAEEAEKARAETERENLEKFKARQAAMVEEASEGLDKSAVGTIAIKDLASMEPSQKIAPVEKQQAWIEPEKPESKPIAVITVGRDEYAQLKRDSQLLAYLKELGVDNWNGWEQACAMLDEYDKKTAYKVKAA